MSDKRPDETINPHKATTGERGDRTPPPPRPTPSSYPLPPSKRPTIPHSSHERPPAPGPRRPAPEGRPVPYPSPDRRPAMHPTTGERPKRRTTSDDTMVRTRPPSPGLSSASTSDSTTRSGYPRRRPTQEGREFLSHDDPTHDESDAPPPRSRARRRTQFAAFNIIMIVIIAVVGLTVFAMSFQSIFADDRNANVATTPTPVPTPTPLPINAQTLTGIITNLNETSNLRTITMMDIATNQSREFTFQDTTSLVNRTGISITFNMLSVGNMMETIYNPDNNNELLDMRQSFTNDFLSRTGVRIDMENTSITLGNEVLTFTSQTLVLYRGMPAVITDITQDDIVTIVAVDNVIWLIQIESSHGNLRVTSADSIMNGRIILDPIGSGAHRVMTLNDIGPDGLILPEGTYRVTVEGTNIETYITELVIRHGETTTLDLSDVEPGLAVLELRVTPTGALVFINNAIRHDHAEPMEFEFGEVLAVRVEHEGYVTHERTIEMNNITTTASINLEVEIITSTVTIMTHPIGANVWVDNMPVGQTPVVTELMPGTYNIVAQMPGFEDLHTTIYVPEGPSIHNLTMTEIVVYEPYIPQEHHPYPPHHYPPYPPTDDNPYEVGSEGGDNY